MRIAHRGYAHLQAKSAIVVVAIFSKTEVANFTAADRAEIAVWLGLFERSYR